MTKSTLYPTVFIAGAILALAFVLIFKQTPTVYGSTARGSEYQGTTTVANVFPATAVLQTTSGTLGSVVITGAAAGVINIYDATTSDITQRAPSMSSSTQLLATIPASTVAGTYTFDRSFYQGLVVSIVGTVPTTTITYRQ